MIFNSIIALFFNLIIIIMPPSLDFLKKMVQNLALEYKRVKAEKQKQFALEKLTTALTYLREVEGLNPDEAPFRS